MRITHVLVCVQPNLNMSTKCMSVRRCLGLPVSVQSPKQCRHVLKTQRNINISINGHTCVIQINIDQVHANMHLIEIAGCLREKIYQHTSFQSKGHFRARSIWRLALLPLAAGGRSSIGQHNLCKQHVLPSNKKNQQ